MTLNTNSLELFEVLSVDSVVSRRCALWVFMIFSVAFEFLRADSYLNFAASRSVVSLFLRFLSSSFLLDSSNPFFLADASSLPYIGSGMFTPRNQKS